MICPARMTRLMEVTAFTVAAGSFLKHSASVRRRPWSIGLVPCSVIPCYPVKAYTYHM